MPNNLRVWVEPLESVEEGVQGLPLTLGEVGVMASIAVHSSHQADTHRGGVEAGAVVANGGVVPGLDRCSIPEDQVVVADGEGAGSLVEILDVLDPQLTTVGVTLVGMGLGAMNDDPLSSFAVPQSMHWAPTFQPKGSHTCPPSPHRW